MTLIVDLDDNGVLALHKQVADVVVKSRKAANVVSSFLAIDVYMAIVIHGTEIQQRLIILHRHSLEALLKPDSTLVEEQTLILCVPVTRNPHRGRLVKVVLN